MRVCRPQIVCCPLAGLMAHELSWPQQRAGPEADQRDRCEQLVSAIFARASAVFSARFNYLLRPGLPRRRQQERPYEFACCAESWMKRIGNGRLIYIKHGGKLIEYRPSHRDVTVWPPQCFDAQYAWPPFFAETFWYRCTKVFVLSTLGRQDTLAAARHVALRLK